MEGVLHCLFRALWLQQRGGVGYWALCILQEVNLNTFCLHLYKPLPVSFGSKDLEQKTLGGHKSLSKPARPTTNVVLNPAHTLGSETLPTSTKERATLVHRPYDLSTTKFRLYYKESETRGYSESNTPPRNSNLTNLFLQQDREGKGYIAVPACGGSLAEAKRACKKQNELEAQSDCLADRHVTGPRQST
eukprot:1139248-Pelagomonas_calceolata.AAC.1